MSVLVYCVAEASAPLPSTGTGVRGLPVVRVAHSGLAVFISRDSSSDAWTRPLARESVLEFHQVLRQLFLAVSILPFRFPTILSGDQELEAHMESASERYKHLLEKYRTSVQMEVLVHALDKPDALATASGTEYLRTRRSQRKEWNQIVDGLESVAGSAVIEWRVRSLPQGVCWFARLERHSVDQFNAAMKTWKLPAGHVARVSGPWPVTEFFLLDQS
jgi:hypothetical protein